MAPFKAYLFSLLAAAGTVLAHPREYIPRFSQKQIDSGEALSVLNKIATANAYKNFGGHCNKSNVKIRREWRTIPKPQRRQFIAAVKCIMAKPSNLPPGEVPGAKSLYDALVCRSFPFHSHDCSRLCDEIQLLTSSSNKGLTPTGPGTLT
jgi:hypothetical protein